VEDTRSGGILFYALGLGVLEPRVQACPEGMVKLNPSAGEILALCDGERSIGAIIAALEARFPGAELDQDVHRFLEVALENGWIRIR
jgi:pyrroloquinoline quinone biosynthesis protein D